MVIDNLTEARKSRRLIIELLRKQQAEDSYCAEKLKQVGLEANRRLLELLAHWLVSFEPGKEPNEYDQSALAAAQLSLGDWLSAQHREALLNDGLTEARRREEGAYKLYDKVAPYGFASIFLMKGAEKTNAERFQQEHRSAKASREEIEQQLAEVREGIRKTIGSFLRTAIEPECLLKLLKTESSIKDELSKLFRQFGDKGGALWEPHSVNQLLSLRELQNETAGLLDFYSTHAAKPEKLLP